MRPFIIAIETFEIDIQEIPWHCRCVRMASFFDGSLSIATDMQIFTLAKWMGILYIYISFLIDHDWYNNCGIGFCLVLQPS
ncbi:hypothetical protein ABG067_003858 [Albugo candida]